MAFTSPQFSIPEIVTIMAESQMFPSITEADLRNPTPNFILNLYSAILIHLDFLQDDPAQVDFGALERLENPDMHLDSVRVLNLLAKVKEALMTLECPLNFTLNDLVQPDPNRHIKFLSALLNFYLYKDTKLSMLKPIEEELVALDELRKEKETRNSQLEDEIAALKEAREREKPLVQEVQTIVKELMQTLENLNSRHSQLRSELVAKRDKSQEMHTNVTKAEFELVQATTENANLRSKIVQSPDKLQRALEDKKAALAEAKASDRQAMLGCQEKTTILEVYTKVWEKMKKQLDLMRTIQDQVNSSKSTEKDVKQLKTKVSDEHLLLKSLEARLVEYESKAAQSDQHLSRSEREKILRIDEITKKLNSVKLEAEARKHDLEAKERKHGALLNELHEIEAKIKSKNESAAATQGELLRKIEMVVNQIYMYSSSMEQSMQAAGLAGLIQILDNSTV